MEFENANMTRQEFEKFRGKRVRLPNWSKGVFIQVTDIAGNCLEGPNEKGRNQWAFIDTSSGPWGLAKE